MVTCKSVAQSTRTSANEDFDKAAGWIHSVHDKKIFMFDEMVAFVRCSGVKAFTSSYGDDLGTCSASDCQMMAKMPASNSVTTMTNTEVEASELACDGHGVLHNKKNKREKSVTQSEENVP